MIKNKQIDQHWFTLILEAKKIGLTIDEIKNFLKSESNQNSNE